MNLDHYSSISMGGGGYWAEIRGEGWGRSGTCIPEATPLSVLITSIVLFNPQNSCVFVSTYNGGMEAQ